MRTVALIWGMALAALGPVATAHGGPGCMIDEYTPPGAVQATATPGSAPSGETITFDSSGTPPRHCVASGGSHFEDYAFVGTTWDFADGTPPVQSSGSGATHAFARKGTYIVKVTRRYEDGSEATGTVSVEITNRGPTAAFNDPGAVRTGREITMSAAASNDVDGSISSYAWDFGDGSTANGLAPVHTFTVRGSYTVTLHVTDNDGAVASVQRAVVVRDLPTARFAASPDRPRVQSVSVDGATSAADPSLALVSYIWDFGDGSAAKVTSGPATTHNYSRGGTYRITLTVVDGAGERASLTREVKVSSAFGGVRIKRVTRRAATVRLTIACPSVGAAAGCSGTARLLPSRGKGEYGRAKFQALAGRSVVVTVKLSRGALTRMKRGRLAAKLVLAARSGKSPVRTTRRSLKLR